jgi:hypothetical protein
MTSAERILEYSDLPSEHSQAALAPPSQGWPQHGAIVFSNVHMRYSKSLPYVLHGVSFSIAAKNKVNFGMSFVAFSWFRVAHILLPLGHSDWCGGSYWSGKVFPADCPVSSI